MFYFTRVALSRVARGGSRISLRVRSILVTFCNYFCSLYIILVLCATLCSFSTSNSQVFAFSRFACVCMFVCVLCIEQGEAFQTCVDTRTCVPAFFCFAVRKYKFLNLAHTYWHVQSRFLHVALVLVVVLLLETMVLVVLVFVLVLVVLLVLVGAAGVGEGGGGSVGRMNFGTSFAPRSPTSFAPRHNCNKVRVLFYCIGLRATITLQSGAGINESTVLSVPYHADWTCPMNLKIWRFLSG